MKIDPQTPVLVGVGVAGQREDDPLAAREPFELMVLALEAAASDAGTRETLLGADSIRVPRGFWAYSDPARLISERIGAKQPSTQLAELGILQQTLFDDACRAISAGEESIALVVGGDTKYRSLRARLAGIEAPDTQQQGVEPDSHLVPAEPFWLEAESSHGLMMPVQFFTIIESALRYAEGLGLDAHRDRIAELWAAMSGVAVANPHAWRRTAVRPEEIRNETAENVMQAFPYTKQHNSDWNVDQAAGLIFCSAAKARELGIPEERWVFPHAGTENNHVVPVSAREAIHRSIGTALAGRRALELAQRRIEEIDHLDLYSCFPVAVEVAARELGISLDRPLTVTGGMRFAGGPLNNYVLQAVARMAEVLRADPGSFGMVTSVSGFMNKQGFGIWSTAPPPAGFGFADVSEEVAAASRPREVVVDYQGPAAIAGYTVLYLGEAPMKAVAVCDLPDARRAVASREDHAVALAMTREEFCGRGVRIESGGVLSLT